MSTRILILLALGLGSCDFFEKHFSTGSEQAAISEGDGNRSYYASGKLKSVCYSNESGERHGVCTSYFENGSKKNEITYENGEKKKGISFYEAGGPAMEIHYENGRKNGMRTRYFEDGKVASQFEYKDDKPGIGLKEFNKSGKQITSYPELIVKTTDRIETHGTYLIEIYFDKNKKRGEYYIGELWEGKFLKTYIGLAWLETHDGVAKYEVMVPKGTYRMEKLNFVGHFETLRGNPYIVQKSLNLAVDNPY